MTNQALFPDQINLMVRDLARSMAFYRLLGWEVGEPTGPHVTISFANGMHVDLDQDDFACQWNSGTPQPGAGALVLCVSTSTREEVDTIYHRMVGAGYESRQIPYDAFWGSRFAVIADPDGYQIGLLSPTEKRYQSWPPTDAPRP